MTTPSLRGLSAFFAPLDLPADARRTYRFHWAYAMLDAAAGGILLNAPLVAIRAIGGQNWQLPIREAYSGIGMLVTLYLGSWMAPRRKMPFVFIPGMLAGFSALAMALAVGNAFLFLTLFGIGAMLEITTRPAVTAILRLNYPVAQRGHATGRVRQWSSLFFVVSNLGAAYVLQQAGGHLIPVAQIQIVCAAVLGVGSFLCFRQIQVRDDPAKLRNDYQLQILKNVQAAVEVVFRDGRYRRYLFGCFLDGFCQMLYVPFIWAFLSETLAFNYFGCAALMHAIPALAAVCDHRLAGLVDRPLESLGRLGMHPLCVGIGRAAAGDYAAGRRLFSSVGLCPPDSGEGSARRCARRLVDTLVADWGHPLRPARRRHQPLHGPNGLSQRGRLSCSPRCWGWS